MVVVGWVEVVVVAGVGEGERGPKVGCSKCTAWRFEVCRWVGW